VRDGSINAPVRGCTAVEVVSPVLHGVQGLAQIHRCVMCDVCVCVCECVYVYVCVYSPVFHGVQGLAQIHRCVMCGVCVCECVYVCGQPCVAWRTRARTDTQVRDV